MTITLECPECGEENEWEVTPGHDAPEVQNHDHPGFSDPGEGPQIEKGSLECKCGYEWDEDTIFEQIDEQHNGPDDERDCD
jgi:hypothetical protein